MKALVKYIVAATYRPLLIRYLSKTRTYSYKGICLRIPPEVFHPGFFSSTKLLLRYIVKANLKNKTCLELGAGSGLLSVYAAKKGASVVASDISSVAIQCINANAADNKVKIRTIHSNLFDNIPQQKFDFILINPPYYRKKPLSIYDHAWYCGENGEYFQSLFKTIGEYMHSDSNVFMVLCDACDFQLIHKLATENFFEMECVYSKKTLIEVNSILKILHKK
jgi:release factor glutamine methyltransferase